MIINGESNGIAYSVSYEDILYARREGNKVSLVWKLPEFRDKPLTMEWESEDDAKRYFAYLDECKERARKKGLSM